MSAIVITPCTGSNDFARAHQSVLNQTYKDVIHLMVVDGLKYEETTEQMLFHNKIFVDNQKLFKCVLPFNTGANHYFGQRIMAAFSYLNNAEFVFFLDQDCWYDPIHIETMIGYMRRNMFDWCYSLRKVYGADGKFICNDDCESLGEWPIWISDEAFLIDNNCYGFTHGFLRKVGHLMDWQREGDRRFLHIVTKQMGHTAFGGTGLYTLNYALGSNEESVKPEFFLKGNQVMLEKYGDESHFPWRK